MHPDVEIQNLGEKLEAGCIHLVQDEHVNRVPVVVTEPVVTETERIPLFALVRAPEVDLIFDLRSPLLVVPVQGGGTDENGLEVFRGLRENLHHLNPDPVNPGSFIKNADKENFLSSSGPPDQMGEKAEVYPLLNSLAGPGAEPILTEYDFRMTKGWVERENLRDGLH